MGECAGDVGSAIERAFSDKYFVLGDADGRRERAISRDRSPAVMFQQVSMPVLLSVPPERNFEEDNFARGCCREQSRGSA